MEQQTQNKPWTDLEGKVLSDKQLREVSRSWDQATWDQFLTETVEGSASYQREELISSYCYDQVLDETAETIWECSTSPEIEDLCELVRRLCRDYLTPKQQYIIRMTFWDCFSIRQIAEVMNVTHSTVVDQKKAALKKIKHLLESRQSNFPRYERVSQTRPDQKGSSHEDILEVYSQEISPNQFGKFRGGI